MLSSSNYLQPQKRSYLYSHKEWNEDHFQEHGMGHIWSPVQKAPNKRKKAQKSAKKLERKYGGTDDCIIDVRNLYPAPLLQIFSKKLKLKLQGTCLKESAPRDIEKGTQSKLIRSLYVQRMYKFWKWIKKSIRYDLGDYDMTYPKTCPSISCWQIRRWSKPPRWSNLLQLTSRYP